ncbi:MAG: phenylalanine--tRNA ligase subunit beta [Deltaproteobacteria bacterium]|jgi:phenylalanyl-tRNA synthetase beta chain|nr:phenylalanine--tRNA ligase subunit beta [Deltaproteobacteria bacterium]
MLLSVKWLRELTPCEAEAQTISDKLTMLGLEVEDIRRPFAELKDIVVGHVVECGKHPDADKLSVCKVDAGQGALLDIVCGAPNVARGQKVPVAPVGAVLPGGMEIKKAKLRGQASNGMICSERELAVSGVHDGIMVLPEDLAPGRRLLEALDLDEEVLDINVTPNRADCLSVLGLAREVALAFKLPLRLPEGKVSESGADASDLARIVIPDPELCPLYQGRILEGAVVGPSPLRVRCRLLAMGVRALSNIVDATNYVLLEWGQPLHAFDLDKMRGGRIVVSAAARGERILTLDGQERALEEGDLLIRDGDRPVALTGIMGGQETEITGESSRVFLESAIFRPTTIRRTARRLGISGEASYRFERGVDQAANTLAMNRACALMTELSGASVRPGVCRAEPKPRQVPEIRFRPRRAQSLLGVSLDAAFCRDTLIGLGCKLEDNQDVWTVQAPSWRHDLSREADVIEELGRVHGLDKIEPEPPRVERSLDAAAGRESKYSFWARVKSWACGLGLNEAVNYSFVGHADLDALRLPAEGRISIMNPLSAEQDVLRTALAPGLLQNLRHNLAQGAQGLRLFELAHVFVADAASETAVREYGRLAILLYGRRFDSAWPHKDEEADYHDLKGLVEHLCVAFRLPPPECGASAGWDFLSPCVDIMLGADLFGRMGRVLPEIADTFHARKDVWLAELDLDLLYALHHAAEARFVPLPVFPPVRRDITVVGSSLSAGAVLAHVRDMGISHLEDVRLIDLFEQKDQDERNLTFRLTFRHTARTLKDAEVDKEREKVAQSLQQALGVRI